MTFQNDAQQFVTPDNPTSPPGDGHEDGGREAIIAAVRQIEVGPFGPNSMAILNRGGFTRLTPSEAEQVADAVEPIVSARVAAAVAAELRDVEREIRDAKTLDRTTQAAVCAVIAGRARRIARSGS